MLSSILAISLGASMGAVTRWLLGTSLNAVFPTIPPGTVAANLLGGYLIGVALSNLASASKKASWSMNRRAGSGRLAMA